MATSAREALSTEEVLLVAQAYAEAGGHSIKLTGGDPALWEPLIPTVERLRHIPGLRHIEVISRHPQIGALSTSLASAGASVINMSIDTLQPERHQRITGVNDLPDVLAALKACTQTSVHCKVNTVIMRGVNDDETEALVDFCEDLGVSTVKFLDVIQDLDVGIENFVGRLHLAGAKSVREFYIPLSELAQKFKNRAIDISLMSQGAFGHPMEIFTLPSGMKLLFKDSTAGAWYGTICRNCLHYPCHDALMALRLTADFRLQFCLLGDEFAVDLRPHFNVGLEAIRAELEKALDVYESATFVSTLTSNTITIHGGNPGDSDAGK